MTQSRTETGLIAFFDVSGYRSLLLNNDVHQCASIIQEILLGVPDQVRKVMEKIAQQSNPDWSNEMRNPIIFSALRVLEWVNLSRKTSLSQCRWAWNGFQGEASSFTMDRCQRKRSGVSFGTHIDSTGLFQAPRSLAFLVIQARACLRWGVAEKNGLWGVWLLARELLRQEGPPRSGSFLRRHSHLSGGRGAAGGMQALWHGQTRATGLAGG